MQIAGQHCLVPTLRVGTRYLAALRRGRRAIDAERRNRAFPRRAWERDARRTGGVYIAVLGTSLIVSLLALSALMSQRIQNRITTTSADIRQAQLNAHTAVELALLTMKQNTNWRTTQPHGRWFTGRGTGDGTCSVDVIDTVDANLANNADDPVLVRGIGYSGQAEQRVEVTVDSRKQPISSLRSAVAAGDLINLQSDTLRTNGLTTANEITASSSLVYGNVEAVTISGSTFSGTKTQVTSDKRPAMPDWSTMFNYYRANGTQLSIGNLPDKPATNFARNWSIESGTTDWAGTAPGLAATATVSQSNNWSQSPSSNTFSLRVTNRSHWSAGGIQRIEHFVKPGQQYDVGVFARVSGLLGTRTFRITLYTKGTGNGSASSDTSPAASVTVILGINLPVAQVTGRLTAPAWSGDLEYAFIKVSDDSNSGSTAEFWLDDLTITEVSTGRFIYRQALGPGINTLYASAPTNAQGIYWINCNGSRLVIERSRILGTLLVVNPGAGSCVAYGPISWSPAVPGYPALLVDADNASDADFAINATNAALSETDNRVNYNPVGAAHEDFGQDADTNDIYRSAIRGLIAIEDDLTYSNRALIRGQILVGDDIANSSGELEIEFLPDSLLNPPPGFWAPIPYSYQRRPASARKLVLP